MSYQDVRHHYEDRDGDAPRRTIPPNPKPGERFMERWPGGSYDCYSWSHDVCSCVGRHSGEEVPRPDAECPDCKGTGDGILSPELIVGGLSERDARLLVFGERLIQALNGGKGAKPGTMGDNLTWMASQADKATDMPNRGVCVAVLRTYADEIRAALALMESK